MFVNSSVELQSLCPGFNPMLPGLRGPPRIPGLSCPREIWAVGYHQVTIRPWVQWKTRLGGGRGGCVQISRVQERSRWFRVAPRGSGCGGRAAKAGCLRHRHRFSNLRCPRAQLAPVQGNPAAGSGVQVAEGLRTPWRGTGTSVRLPSCVLGCEMVVARTPTSL